MSQSYVIRVSASVQETVHAKDKRTKSLVLTEIVPPAEQQEILRERLKERGFQEVAGSEGRRLERVRDGIRETVDLDAMTHEAELEVSRTLERQRTITVRGDRDLESIEERRAKERSELERSIAISDEERQAAHTGMQREVAERLEEADAARTRELNEAVRETYAESLKRKAARLGSITEVRESRSGEDYELIIKLTE